jgi:TM2 domain-containing membrane protein YozV
LDDKAVVCIKCGADPKKGVAYCSNCGKPTDPNAVVCVICGVGFKPANAECNKIAAGLLAIFLGWLGIHKFIMGYTKEGVIMLLVSLVGGALTCSAAASVVWIIGLIYLTKSDEDFVKTYITGKRGGF